MIKKLLVIFLFIVSVNVNAQSSRERLGDIEWEQKNKELKQKVENLKYSTHFL